MKTITVEPRRDGGWQVTVPGEPERRYRVATRHVAEYLARAQAADADVVVRDAYHRVVRPHGAGTDPSRRPAPSERRARPAR